MSLPGKYFAAGAEDEEKHRTLAVEEEDIGFYVGFKVDAPTVVSAGHLKPTYTTMLVACTAHNVPLP